MYIQSAQKQRNEKTEKTHEIQTSESFSLRKRIQINSNEEQQMNKQSNDTKQNKK